MTYKRIHVEEEKVNLLPFRYILINTKTQTKTNEDFEYIFIYFI